jgi:cephalosporin-C deacetylase
MKILNFGSVNIDHVYHVPRFLQPGETMAAASSSRFPGGKGFNQSVALARAGARVFHAGHVGADGAWLVDFLRAEGVDTTFLTPVDAPTGHAIIQVDPSGQNCILLDGGANRRLAADDVRAALAGAAIGPGDVVLLQNETSATAEILSLSAATGATVAFNAAPMGEEVAGLPLDKVGLFIVNELEGAALCGTPEETDGGKILDRLRTKFPEADILLTLGSSGSLYGPHADRPAVHAFPAQSARVADTTAAGDTFTGYFLAARAEGAGPVSALDIATRAAAVCVSRPGAAPSIPRRDELAAPWDDTLLRGVCDRDPVSYATGDPIVFTLRFENPPEARHAEGCEVRWRLEGDDGATASGAVPAADVIAAPLEIRASLACPGFVRLRAVLHGPDGRPVCHPLRNEEWWEPLIAFDGGAGADIDALRAEPEPADFDAFWERQKAKLATVPVRAERVEAASPDPALRMFAVTVDCPGPRPVTGYLSMPAGASPANTFPAQVFFQGYGMNAPAPDRVSQPLPRDAIRFEINAHGVDLGRDDYRYYNDFFMALFSNGYPYGFDPEQNRDPETAYFAAMALRVLRALEYVRTLPEWNRKDLVALGGSQGGLQAMWAAGLDPRVTEAYPDIPWCCDLAGVTANRMASPWRIPYVPGIDYFDPVHHARRVRCPVHIPRAGLGDYTCPPSGIAILYNNLARAKSIRWVQGSQHGYIPPEPNQEAFREAAGPE